MTEPPPLPRAKTPIPMGVIVAIIAVGAVAYGVLVYRNVSKQRQARAEVRATLEAKRQQAEDAVRREHEVDRHTRAFIEANLLEMGAWADVYFAENPQKTTVTGIDLRAWSDGKFSFGRICDEDYDAVTLNRRASTIRVRIRGGEWVAVQWVHADAGARGRNGRPAGG